MCIAHRTGQRISGPLFFGFSDAVTQQAVATALYTETEVAAALAGEVVQPEELTAEEVAAREFRQVIPGVGEKIAMTLACTCALGGGPHSGVASLRAWVQQSAENATTLLNFLRTSEEIPEATRRWPQWGNRIVGKIIVALQTSPSAAAAALWLSEKKEVEKKEV